MFSLWTLDQLLFINHHFVFRGQRAEFFLSKKIRQMKASQNYKYDIIKTSGLVQVWKCVLRLIWNVLCKLIVCTYMFTYDVIDVLIWQQVGWTPQKISVISVIFRPFVTKALVSSPKSMIITGIVQPPHMAAIIPKASKILSWALENRNWNKTMKCYKLSRNRAHFVRESEDLLTPY